MKSLKDPAVDIDEQRTAAGEPETVSHKKLNANRQNARKSTGPRTPRGKAISRQNAIKHGLFTGLAVEFLNQGECLEEYDRLLDDLHKQFEPIGRAEELEVERIRVCWWKLQRVWRYENSENQILVLRAAKALEQIEKSYKRLDEEREAIILGLQNMIAELSVASEMPPDLKDRFFVLTSSTEEDWKEFEVCAKHKLTELVAAGSFSPPHPFVRVWLSLLSAKRSTYMTKSVDQQRRTK